MRKRTTLLDAAVLLLLVLEAPAPQRLAAQGILRNASKECAICHVRWIEAFDRAVEAESGSAQGLPREDRSRQAGSEDMCLSCHDGSVVDSRFKVWSTRHHTTGQAPSPKVDIPTETFPLDSEGCMTCSTCHTAHALPQDTDMRTAIFLRMPNVDSSLCLACHPDHAQKSARQHRLGRLEEEVPEVILEAGGQAGPDGKLLMCQTCHEPHGARNDWMLVLPPSELCTACHEDRSLESLREEGSLGHHIDHAYQGFEPPERLLEEKATFGPDGELTCLSCHRLHDASGAWPLLIVENEKGSLCIECHPGERRMFGSSHDFRLSAPEVTNARGEKASESGPCGACHLVHGWAVSISAESRSRNSACLECHEEGGVAFERRPYVEAHPIGVDAPEDWDGISLPVVADTRKVGCFTCHDPHSPPGGADRAFLRQEGSKLCMPCHENLAGGHHEPENFSPAALEALSLNTSRGSCLVCHRTHNARGPHLWALEPGKAGEATMSSLCGSCHGTPYAPTPRDTLHPVIPERPASDGAAADDSTATVDCHSCHDPHAKAEPALVDEAVCSSCHERKHLTRDSPHDPATQEWGKQLTRASSNSCLACHSVHGQGRTDEIRRSVGLPLDTSALTCEACHRDGGLAEAVITPHVGKEFPEEARGVALETVSEGGGRIGCTTCHDLHAGNLTPGLLRGDAESASICTGCHPAAAPLPGTRHDLRVSAPGERNRKGHVAAESGPCGACHLVHPLATSSGGPHETTTWARAPVAGAAGADARCRGCHEVEEGDTDSGSGHDKVFVDRSGEPLRTEPFRTEPLGTVAASNVRPGAEGGVRASDRAARDGSPQLPEVTCLACHEPHTAAADRKDDSRSKVAPRPAFLREEPEKAVCLACHDREIEVAPGKRLPDMAALLKETKYHHGLIREGRCIPCHNIHRGGNPHLLAEQFTEKMYADFERAEYALCLSCHQESMLEVSRAKDATGFRDGATNLHALHVHREEKGRSCRFCHEFHGSNIPKLIRKSTPFGRKGWELPIGFTKTERGGTCSPGCHKQESYDRGMEGGS